MHKLKLKQIEKLTIGKNINVVVKRLCGEMIGSGCYRDVYILKQNPDYVVKIERDMSTGAFANATEWRNYINNQDWLLLAEWMAPCELINQTGQVLIQRRVTRGRRKDYPKYIPAVFSDFKLANFGWIDEKFVCCDYSYMRTVIGKKLMYYAKWWGTLKQK